MLNLQACGVGLSAACAAGTTTVQVCNAGHAEHGVCSAAAAATPHLGIGRGLDTLRQLLEPIRREQVPLRFVAHPAVACSHRCLERLTSVEHRTIWKLVD